MTTTKKRTTKTAKPAPKKPSELALPSPQQVQAARERRRSIETTDSEFPAGTVLGLPDGWVAAILDPDLSDGRQEALRAKWLAKGWIELEGLQTVVGFAGGAHVFVKTTEDYKIAKRERDDKIATARANGQMFG